MKFCAPHQLPPRNAERINMIHPSKTDTFSGNTVIKYQQGVACKSKLKKWFDNKDIFRIGNKVYIRGKQQVHIKPVKLEAFEVLFRSFYRKTEQSHKDIYI